MATSKPSRLPAITELAARVRHGETVDSVAASCGVARVTILNRFSDAGFTSTGEEKQGAERMELKAYLKSVALTWAEPWMSEGICASTDPEAFFPEVGISGKEAKQVCLGCPVREICLQYALQHKEKFGIWGGKSERDRRKILKDAA